MLDKHEMDPKKILESIQSRKMELLEFQDSEEPITDEEAFQIALDEKIDDELVWESDILEWIGYFGVIRVNEQIAELGGNIHSALGVLLRELIEEAK